MVRVLISDFYFCDSPSGLVFRDLLTDLDENIDPNAVFPWFHRILTKNEAVERLVQGKPTNPECGFKSQTKLPPTFSFMHLL